MPQSEIEIVKIGFYLDVKNVSLSLEAAKKVSPPDFSVTLEDRYGLIEFQNSRRNEVQSFRGKYIYCLFSPFFFSIGNLNKTNRKFINYSRRKLRIRYKYIK